MKLKHLNILFCSIHVWHDPILNNSSFLLTTDRVESLPCLEEPVCGPPVGGPADQQQRQQGRVQVVEAQQDGAVPDHQVAAASRISSKKKLAWFTSVLYVEELYDRFFLNWKVWKLSMPLPLCFRNVFLDKNILHLL